MAKLTREQKELRLAAIQEKKRREKLKKALYQPNPGQQQVHECEKRERWVFSGNGAGKTCMLVNEAIWALEGYNPILETYTHVPAKVVVVLDSPEKVEQKFLPEFQKWRVLRSDQQHKKGKPYISQLTMDNGSTLQFFFFDQDPFKFEGIDDIDFVASDEPMPRPVYIGLSRGLRGKDTNPRVLVVGTPLAQPWLRQEIYEPWTTGDLPETECFRFSTDVNRENLREGYIEEFSAKLSDAEKEVRLKGGFFDVGSLALAHLFDRKVHIIDKFRWPKDWPCVVALDFHPSKDHIACLVGVSPKQELYYIKEFASKSVPRVLAEELKEFMRDFKVVDIVCDSLGNSPMTGGDGNKSFIQVLNEYRVRVRATSYKDKNDEDFISRIQETLVIPKTKDNLGRKIPKLRVFEGNMGIVRDIENVSWQKWKHSNLTKPKLEIGNRDYLACLKYALSSAALHFSENYGKILRMGRSPWSGTSRKTE